jgi:hypothetical protein
MNQFFLLHSFCFSLPLSQTRTRMTSCSSSCLAISMIYVVHVLSNICQTNRQSLTSHIIIVEVNARQYFYRRISPLRFDSSVLCRRSILNSEILIDYVLRYIFSCQSLFLSCTYPIGCNMCYCLMSNINVSSSILHNLLYQRFLDERIHVQRTTIS